MEDLNLRTSDIQSLSNVDAIASFFTSLGYNVERLPQTTAALGITNEALTRNIEEIEQIAVQDGELYIYLFEMKSMRVSDRQALARTFRNADGEYLRDRSVIGKQPASRFPYFERSRGNDGT